MEKDCGLGSTVTGSTRQDVEKYFTALGFKSHITEGDQFGEIGSYFMVLMLSVNTFPYFGGDFCQFITCYFIFRFVTSISVHTSIVLYMST